MDTEEKSKDLRSAADIAMARHVDNFEIPAADAGAVDSPEIAAEIAAEVKELKLPKTLKATHQLLQEILAIEPETQREEVVKRGKLSFVRSYLSELEQGAPTPVISMAAHKEITGRQSEHANDLHLQELAKVHPEVRAVVLERDALMKKANSAKEVPNVELAGALYTKYCVSVGGKAFNGDSLPAWKDFLADEKKSPQVAAWVSVAEAAKQLLGN